MKTLNIVLIALCSLIGLEAEEEKNKYVTVKLMGQLGNQLFQIATAYAYAKDYNLDLTIPDLVDQKNYGIPHNAEKLFLDKISCERSSLPIERRFCEPSFNYHPIPFYNRIELFGYFQSEKYFRHRREEILDLFAPPNGMNEAILAKYPFLDSDALTVGIQIRDYRMEFPLENYHPTHKRSYYEKALALFPDDAIFIVSSNNKQFAKECLEGLKKNLIYLNEDYIQEFYTLALCKSFIISNSSFGWWASWLSTFPDKKVIAPSAWFAPPYNNEMMTKDILPSDYLTLK